MKWLCAAVAVCLIGLVFSCATPEPEPPVDEGPSWEDRMEALMTEIAQAPEEDPMDWTQFSGELIEAEDQVWEWAMVESEHPGFTGLGYVNFDNAPGGWLEFTISVPSDSNYYLIFTYAHGADGNRVCRVEIDGALAKERLDFVPTGGWTTYTQKGMEYTLSAGEHVIRLTGTEIDGGPNFDSLIIVPVQ
jgi:hypothetical protein